MPRQIGFFSRDEMDTIEVSGGVARCSACGLFQTCRTPRMHPSGKGHKGILIISGAPDETEDRRGVHFANEAGNKLETALLMLGVKLRRDCRIIHAVNCRPPKGRKPTNTEINACRTSVWGEIKHFQPKVILLLGDYAVTSFLGHRWHKKLGNVKRWRGFLIPDRIANAWVCATYHPSNIVAEKNPQAMEKIWLRDLEQAIGRIDQTLPDWNNHERFVRTTVSEQQSVKLLQKVNAKQPPLITFDYEATGIKPDRKGHHISCVSLCWSRSRSYAFPVTPAVKKALAAILQNKAIRKAASNMSYEDQWTQVHLGCSVRNWFWDTMLAARILDQRRDTSSLKFQAYVRYGVLGYDREIRNFLKATKEESRKHGANSINRVDKIPQQQLLLYNALDSLYEYWLARDQMNDMGIRF